MRVDRTSSPATVRLKLGFTQWISHILSSSVIIAILIFVIINFYLFASINLSAFFYIFLIFSLITDGIFILLQTLRRKVNHKKLTCDPSKLTIVIACYNGADVIAETVKHALRHVPKQNIIVVSDASTDSTEDIVKRLGVRLIVNHVNLNKVLSINRAMKEVGTPYVLLLDDDVLIGDTTIPTNLLDEGYTAVAFNVMPIKNDSWANRLQVFEYRNSMQIGKNLRARSGGIGNVSGAIGLYRTEDLLLQTTLHSSQFAGEDEQRTILAQLYGKGKGITYTDQVVLTHTPDSFGKLYRQRAHSWSLALPELFSLYWRLLFSPKAHYLLKAEKAYYLYIYMTDPLRILFIWVLLYRPVNIALIYGFYLIFSMWVWARMRFKDEISVVIVYPVYKLWLMICRFVGNFLWFKEKIKYLKKKLHKGVAQRKLIPEYMAVTLVFLMLWGLSIFRFNTDLQLYRKIQGNKLDESASEFSYEEASNLNTVSDSWISLPVKPVATVNNSEMMILSIEKGDTDRAVAYKAIQQYLSGRPLLQVSYVEEMKASNILLEELKTAGLYTAPNGTLLIENMRIENSINKAISTNEGGA
jgi:cellulose synthase/poly-beta-1,6-N-acetylglucosamine synthase-like glycosyltransferase